MSPRVSTAVVVLLAVATTMLGLALAGVAGIATAAPASAHDRLISSDPEDGATLDEAPAAITLTFSAALLGTGSQLIVTDGQGEEVAAGDPVVDGEVVTASLPGDLPGGDYTVAWRVVSSDGHPIEGTFGFDVAAQGPSPEPSEEAASPLPTGESEPTAEQSPAQGEATSGSDGGRSPWLLGVALLATAAVGTAVVVRSRRQRGSGYGPPGQD